jgi:Phosphotransferase enzyme family
VVEILERRPYAYRTSFPLDEALVRLPDGSVTTVLVKDLSRSAFDEPTRRAKPDFLYDPLREIEVYTEILDDRDLGTARCYGAVAVPEEDRYLLFLEKVDGAELWQKGELEEWESVARWAARLHRDVEPPESVHVIRYDGDYLRRWIDRALSFRGGVELERIAANYEAIVERLAALSRVFVHGELYPSNVLVSGPRVCAVDWEMAGVGPGLLDLAALASAWSDEDVARLARAYGDELGRPVEKQDLDSARLHLAVQWLGWSREWTPPREHAADWLGEAVRAAERLGLCGAS